MQAENSTNGDKEPPSGKQSKLSKNFIPPGAVSGMTFPTPTGTTGNGS